MNAHIIKASDSTKQFWKVPPGRFLVNLCRLEEPFRSKVKGHIKSVVKDMGYIDFCLAENILVIYVTRNEVIYSTYKNRLKMAFQNYKDSQYKLIIVMVNDTTTSKHFPGLQAFSIENLNMSPVIPLAKESKILDFLIDMSDSKQKLPVAKKQQKLPDSVAAEDQIRLVSLIPTVSRDTAQFLLETFGHIRGLSEQNKETLTIVVGEECAVEKIKRSRECPPYDHLVPKVNTKSPVWEHFGLPADENNQILDTNISICKLCSNSEFCIIKGRKYL